MSGGGDVSAMCQPVRYTGPVATKEQWIELLRGVHAGDEEGEAFHGPATRTILRDITAAAASARPIPDAHTIWEIVQHFLGWRELMCDRLEGGTRTMGDEEDWAHAERTTAQAWNDLLKRLDENQGRLLRLVDGLSDSDVEKHEPKLRFLVHHELSHAGQIAVLKKSRFP